MRDWPIPGHLRTVEEPERWPKRYLHPLHLPRFVAIKIGKTSRSACAGDRLEAIAQEKGRTHQRFDLGFERRGVPSQLRAKIQTQPYAVFQPITRDIGRRGPPNVTGRAEFRALWGGVSVIASFLNIFITSGPQT